MSGSTRVEKNRSLVSAVALGGVVLACALVLWLHRPLASQLAILLILLMSVALGTVVALYQKDSGARLTRGAVVAAACAGLAGTLLALPAF